jgi:PAS domain S-box-containing protein
MSSEAIMPQPHGPVTLIDSYLTTASLCALALDIARITATERPEQALANTAILLVERIPCDAAFFYGFPDAQVVPATDALSAVSSPGETAPRTMEILAQGSRVGAALTGELERHARWIAQQSCTSEGNHDYVVSLMPYHDDTHLQWVTFRVLPLASAHSTLGIAIVARIGRPFPADMAEFLSQLQPSLVLALGARYAMEVRARSRRRREHLEAVFNNSSDGILTVDEHYRLIELNRAVTDLTGWETGEALGHTCMEVIQCRDDRSQVLCHTPRCPLHQVFTRGQPLPYCEVSFTSRTGKLKEVAASIAFVNSDEGAKGVIIARDVTPLNTANRMRSNFISMVSHELRTPLNSINGFLEIVMEGHVGQLSERQYEFLSYARSSTQQLMSLVEDVLFISKADTGQFELRCSAVNFPDLVTQLVHNLEPLARSAEVMLECHIPEPFPKLDADAVRLQQVLTNLLNNAIKFTPSAGQVLMEASYDAREALVCVADTGCGVPYEDQPHIFERFYQSDNASLVKHGGYGLGLAIAKLIVEQHGGRIWLESEPDRGAKFWFTLPLWHGSTANGHNDC